jgi:hypothetical protein
MEAMVEGRICFRDVGLEVVTTLKGAFTIPLNISIMFDENFHRYLVLTSQIVFNVGIKPLVFQFWLSDFFFLTFSLGRFL